jgi:hypothetical protein
VTNDGPHDKPRPGHVRQPSQGLLSLTAGVHLAHAHIEAVATKSGLEVLAIKGPVLNQLELRPRRESSDVDVLSSSGDRALLIDAMSQGGWAARPVTTGGRVLPTHAIHLIHPSWPCDIDAHDRYPGFFAEPEFVFRLFWDRRSRATIAGRSVQTPDLLGHILIAAVHGLREPERQRNRAELDYLTARVRSTLDRSQIDELVRRATALRAIETLTPFLRSVGVTTDLQSDLTPHERYLWEARVSEERSALGWLRELNEAALLHKPNVIFNAVLPSEKEFRLIHPGTPPGTIAFRRAQLSRFVRGAASLARAGRDRALRRRQLGCPGNMRRNNQPPPGD